MKEIDTKKIVDHVWEENDLHSEVYKVAAQIAINQYKQQEIRSNLKPNVFYTPEEIGILIRQRRKMLNVSVPTLAELSDVSDVTLYTTEENKTNLTIKTLTKILDVLGYEIRIVLKSV